MILEISEEIVTTAHLTLEEVRLGLAIWLFQEKQVSLGNSAKVAGMHKMQFQKELGKRKIAAHYTEEDFERDLKSAKLML